MITDYHILYTLQKRYEKRENAPNRDFRGIRGIKSGKLEGISLGSTLHYFFLFFNPLTFIDGYFCFTLRFIVACSDGVALCA